MHQRLAALSRFRCATTHWSFNGHRRRWRPKKYHPNAAPGRAPEQAKTKPPAPANKAAHLHHPHLPTHSRSPDSAPVQGARQRRAPASTTSVDTPANQECRAVMRQTRQARQIRKYAQGCSGLHMPAHACTRGRLLIRNTLTGATPAGTQANQGAGGETMRQTRQRRQIRCAGWVRSRP